MIPKVFHRIWFGDRPRPERYDEYWNQWQELHPTATFLTWTEDNLPSLDNQTVYNQLAMGDVARSGGVTMDRERAIAVQRADVVAYELINQYGGVYLNCDIAPLRSLDKLLLSSSAFFGREDNHFLCNAVMAGFAGHPIFEDLVRYLPSRFRQYWTSGMEVATGPHHLTHVWNSGTYDALVLPVDAFYPVHHSSIPYGTGSYDSYLEIGRQKDSYAVHMWGHRYQEGQFNTNI